MKILAIETSCDETAAAVVISTANHIIIDSNIVASQIDIYLKSLVVWFKNSGSGTC